jgi:putative CocE/NonD family hydrolase
MQLSVEERDDVGCRLRDGTVLRADVYRPSGAGRFPVLLCRTPYDKQHPRYVRIARELAQRGYIAVVQDIRGRNASEGRWTWHMTAEGQAVEADDGYDACEWAAALPHSDGQVGTWGNSYPSWLIWRMAAAQPPSLRAIFTSGFSARTLDCTAGIFETGIRLRWQHHMAVSSRQRAGDTAYPQTVAGADHHWDRLLRGKWIWHLPLSEVPDELFGPDAEMQRHYWRDINREFWALDASYPQVAVPTSTLTGWWDRLSHCSFHFSGMRQDGPAATRERHRLVIGPWVHDVESKGDWRAPRDQGPLASLSLTDELTRWYDFQLKGVLPEDDAPVRLFLVNDGRWTRHASWPPEGVVPTPMYLASSGGANTPAGDGKLLDAPSTHTRSDGYTYDPADPVLSLVEPDGQAAACDQAPLHARRDILVYQTEPLAEDLVLAGPLCCTLWIRSDAPDTDFVARLIEAGPDGLAINISHGILRCRYRTGYQSESTLEPGTPTEITIKMLPVGIRFRRGSRIRLDITSSDFPTFDRNHNTGRRFYDDPELRIAHQTILHGESYPSRIILPVLADG